MLSHDNLTEPASTMSNPDAGQEQGTSDRKFVVALARGLQVLRAFRPSDGYLGNREIAERTRLSKPTVTRLTYTLTKLGYLAHDDQLGKYQLAPGSISIGYAALARLSVRHIARPSMLELANSTGASVALGARDRSSMILVEFCRGASDLSVDLDPGSRIPMATSAIGRALLAVMPADQRNVVMDRIASRSGDNWPATRSQIERAMKEVHDQGFTLSFGEWRTKVNAVGVPFIPSDGSGPFAFNCGGKDTLMSPARLKDDIGPRLVELARRVEAVISGAPPQG